MYNPSVMSIANDYIKLIAIFIYFITGYNLTHKNLVKTTIKWYSVSGMVIGGLGAIFTVLNIRLFLIYYILMTQDTEGL